MSRVPSLLFASAEQPIPSSLTDTRTWPCLARSSTSTEPWRPSGNAYLKQFVTSSLTISPIAAACELRTQMSSQRTWIEIVRTPR